MMKYQKIKNRMEFENESLHSSFQTDDEYAKTTTQVSEIVDPLPQQSMAGGQFKVPHDPPLVNYGYTKEQLFLENQHELRKKAQSLNDFFDKKITEMQHGMSRHQREKDVILIGSKEYHWSLPSHIICFLSSLIPKLNTVSSLKLEDWPTFKQKLLEVLDHRIDQASEINGAVNNSYMSLDEHLVIYCIGRPVLSPLQTQNKNKSVVVTGTREEIQLELINFLYCLKYYSYRWHRAQLYA